MKQIAIITILMLCVAHLSYSQTKETRYFADFHSVYFFGNIEVQMVQSDSNYVELSSDYLKLGSVSTQIKNGRLTISNKSMSNSKNLVAILHYKSVDEIIAKAGVKLKVKDPIKSQKMSFRLSKGAIAHLQLVSDSVTAVVLQGSELIIYGNSNYLKVNTNSGGYFNGFSFEAKDVLLKSVAGGKIELKVLGMMEANANTGGMIYYKGTPTTVSQKVITGGIIEKQK